jgi:hypothetical protein
MQVDFVFKLAELELGPDRVSFVAITSSDGIPPSQERPESNMEMHLNLVPTGNAPGAEIATLPPIALSLRRGS